MKIAVNEIKIEKINQVGLVVNDLEKVVSNYWNIFGVGPHIIHTIEPVPGYVMTYRGKPAKYKFKASFCQVGAVELEILQGLKGPTIYDDYIAEHGEGANHLQFLVDSVEDVNAFAYNLSRQGFTVLMGGHFSNIVGYAYMDTVDALKTIWEAVKLPEGPFGAAPLVFPSNTDEISPAITNVNGITKIGIVVHNLEEVVNNYRHLLGIDSWDVSKLASPALHSVTYGGKAVSPCWKIARAVVGEAILELVQPVSFDNIFSDFLRGHGEGIHHVQFLVDDIEKTNKIMNANGFPVLMDGELFNGSFAYYDTQEALKMTWEAFQLNKA